MAIDLNPNDAVALNNLAWTLAYDLQIELDAALSYALRAVKFRSTASHYDTLGMVYYRLERYHKAVEAYTEALKLDPSMSTTLLQRADSYIELGDTYEAIQDLERYLDVEPNAENVEEIRSRLDALRNQ